MSSGSAFPNAVNTQMNGTGMSSQESQYHNAQA